MLELNLLKRKVEIDEDREKFVNFLENDLALVDGHDTGIEWFASQVHQYKKSNAWWAIIGDKDGGIFGYTIVGMFIELTDEVWNFLNGFGLKKVKNVVTISLYPLNPKTKLDYSHPTEFEIGVFALDVLSKENFNKIYNRMKKFTDELRIDGYKTYGNIRN